MEVEGVSAFISSHFLARFHNAIYISGLLTANTGTFGVVTSAVVKVHPPTTVLSSSLSFTVSGSNSPSPDGVERFWTGFDLYHDFGKTIVDNGGTAW